MTDGNILRIIIEELPLTSTFELDCSYGEGFGNRIFERAKKSLAIPR